METALEQWERLGGIGTNPTSLARILLTLVRSCANQPETFWYAQIHLAVERILERAAPSEQTS